MKYEIAFARDALELKKIVNNMIKDGYTPLGGMTCDISSNHSFLFQAMIKEIEIIKLPIETKNE